MKRKCALSESLLSFYFILSFGLYPSSSEYRHTSNAPTFPYSCTTKYTQRKYLLCHSKQKYFTLQITIPLVGHISWDIIRQIVGRLAEKVSTGEHRVWADFVRQPTTTRNFRWGWRDYFTGFYEGDTGREVKQEDSSLATGQNRDSSLINRVSAKALID